MLGAAGILSQQAGSQGLDKSSHCLLSPGNSPFSHATQSLVGLHDDEKEITLISHDDWLHG